MVSHSNARKVALRGPFLRLALVLCLATPATGTQAESGADTQQRKRFLDAEALVQRGQQDAARALIQGLGDYPLVPYLELAQLSASIKEVTAQRIERFLAEREDLPTTGSLYQSWILEQARRGAWRELARDPAALQHARSPEARCRVAEAQWRSDNRDAAWEQVSALWPSAVSLPEACDPVLAAWRKAGRMSTDQIWRRLLEAVPAGSNGLVRYLRKQLPAAEARRLDGWLALRSRPADIVSAVQRLPADAGLFETVTEDVFQELVKRSPTEAADALSQLTQAETLPPALLATLRERLGTRLAQRDDPLAFGYLRKGHSARALEMRAQLSIELRDWNELGQSLQMMDPETAGQGRWRYWAGRAQSLLGQPLDDPAFHALARERGYYAFLAADRLGRPYNMAPRAIDSGAGELETLARRDAIRRIAEFVALRRAAQARREWFYLLERLDADQLRNAARLASDRDWHALAIFAAGRARSWDDLNLRFPLEHRNLVSRSASSTGLEQARIFAIIRQESAFMVDARSRAGALGPMQLMPATARQVAREMGTSRPSTTQVLEPRLNIMLGSRYLADLHERYDDHPVLATAAYNAGPGNVKRWLPSQGSVASEIWIESIPFNETRGYVRRVLAYQAIYRYRLDQSEARMSSWMPPVRGG